MAFDDAKYRRTAVAGDVGYSIYLSQRALKYLADAIAVIAARANVDVHEELKIANEEIKLLREEFENLTGWKPE